MMSLTDEQLFELAIAYELSGATNAEDFIKKICANYDEMKAIYKSLHRPVVRTGKKDKLGL